MQPTYNKPRDARFILDGVLVEEVPCDQLPVTNMCNYCLLKGTACHSRRDVTCHADSRPDGIGVVFRRVQNATGEPGGQ